MRLFASADIRLRATHKDDTPFHHIRGRMIFDHQRGRPMEYGVVFQSRRGWKAYFRFKDVKAANSFTAEALRTWCDSLDPKDSVERAMKLEGALLAQRIDMLQINWLDSGKINNIFAVVGEA